MAWNEPGNNNGNNGRDNDPWGNNNRGGQRPGGRDQGPPDLDEVFNKLSQKLGGKFGKKGGGGSSIGGGGGAIGFGVIAIIAIAVWIFAGFYTIGEAERGVVLRLGKYDRIVDPGLNWRPRFIDEYEAVNVQAIRSLRASGLMLTKDENVVTVAMDVQYRVADPYKYLYRVTNADDSLRQATDSALRAVIGDSLMDSILTSGRQQIRQSTQETLNQIIDSYDMGLVIVDVNFQSARPPEQVKDAFDDAIAAREDEERFIREAEAYKNEILPKATGRAERLKKEAQGYNERVTNEALGQVAQFEKLLPEYQAAPGVTRDRLYIDAMEEVYTNTSKVLIDSESSGNLLYLPIDKLAGQEGQTDTKRKSKSSSTYDHIQLESERTQEETSNTQSRSTGTRQGRY
ncbi:FtsH protease activity modulator HflK [Vibrio parahaemolyticus]|uniref:Protein HflK n=6 Tax=Vibrio parahaemolyticus TaxID=670 RepID=HFLK_VIBPA|nr:MULTISPECIES: FtsH protease activity modulator HflK [Vibrio]P40605.1 RecName: Full=Protein HflK [Vibrio parahaemolyticus RIMD 2210633]EFO36014.1 protein HflK [Vibrio parahaemolyticus Peru-466]EFO44038.1 protein HflK [Vibrio parahaemolyticus AQ4037]EFO50439.1 protein HflK [Vibrio parahaemolyticus K5030]EJG0766898.1 FtsH protease activity modulator HflK [Vibrio parahaemolyticus O5:K30]EJG0875080.1 FtsH protease activity modulator HflK [Vibrio parahaemolyticus O3]EJG0903708.1 FtsH protease a